MKYIQYLPEEIISPSNLSRIKTIIGRCNIPYKDCIIYNGDLTFSLYTLEQILFIDLINKECSTERNTKKGVKWASKITEFLKTI